MPERCSVYRSMFFSAFSHIVRSAKPRSNFDHHIAHLRSDVSIRIPPLPDSSHLGIPSLANDWEQVCNLHSCFTSCMLASGPCRCSRDSDVTPQRRRRPHAASSSRDLIAFTIRLGARETGASRSTLLFFERQLVVCQQAA